MTRSTGEDAQALSRSLRSVYAATPKNLKVIDLYVAFAVSTALILVVYMAMVGSFPFNSFLSGCFRVSAPLCLQFASASN